MRMDADFLTKPRCAGRSGDSPERVRQRACRACRTRRCYRSASRGGRAAFPEARPGAGSPRPGVAGRDGSRYILATLKNNGQSQWSRHRNWESVCGSSITGLGSINAKEPRHRHNYCMTKSEGRISLWFLIKARQCDHASLARSIQFFLFHRGGGASLGSV